MGAVLGANLTRPVITIPGVTKLGCRNGVLTLVVEGAKSARNGGCQVWSRLQVCNGIEPAVFKMR